MKESSFFSREELEEIGFKKLGENVYVSRKCSIYGAKDISIGSNVRIDDFCVLSGKIELGNYIHIAVYTALFGGNSGIVMEDFSCLSSRCVVYAKSDDFSGEYMSNPMVDEQYLGIKDEKVKLGKHVLVGTGCTILPGVIIGEGTAIGSMSLVRESLQPWGIYIGIPCHFWRDRSKRILEHEKKMMSNNIEDSIG